MNDVDWSDREFLEVDLGDHRLNLRLRMLADQLYKSPMSSVNHACRETRESKAAYRFFDNDKVKPEAIRQPHYENTLERISPYKDILLLQDTSFLNFNSHLELRGRGPIGTRGATHSKASLGFILHSTLAVAPEGEGVPLGLIWQKCWAREVSKDSGPKRKSKIDKRSTKDRESFKWIEGMRESAKLSSEGQRLIHVADREADIGIFLCEAFNLNIQYVVRSNMDRVVIEAEGNKKLSEFMEKQPIKGYLDVKLERISRTKDRRERPARRAKIAIRFERVQLKEKIRRDLKAPKEAFEAWVITADEVKSPRNQKPLHWRLLTNIPIGTLEEAIQKIEWYKMRWHIENYHKTLKTGCRVEDCQVETSERMQNYIALTGIIAWRLYWLSRASRIHCTDSAKDYFSKEELKILSKKIRKKHTDTITIKEAIRAIAMIGGFLGRKGDGNPGMISIWRGWYALQIALDLNGSATYG